VDANLAIFGAGFGIHGAIGDWAVFRRKRFWRLGN
tara:strand:+ start:410 stop:514 length:105 start_codon:yes stop_codon:yes gene_type:complete